MCGDTFRKTRAQVMLIFSRNGEINKGFYRFLLRKGIVKEIHAPTTHTEKLMMMGMEKAASASQFFASASVVNTFSMSFKSLSIRAENGGMKFLPS